MKKRISLVCAALALGFLLAACRPAATPAPTATPGAPPTVATPAAPTPVAVRPPTPVAPGAPVVGPTGELRMALLYTGTESMDPMMGPGSMLTFMEYPYDWLIGVDKEGKLSPEHSIAPKWERTPDAKKWTFYLRKGVKFHNGDEVTAEDIKFGIERIMSPKSLSTFASTFRDKIDRIETPDPYTVVFLLKEPWGILDYFLSIKNQGMEGIVVPKKYIQQVGDEQFALNPIGTGVFKFVKHQVGSFVQFEAVDNHWRLGVPPYKRLYLMIVPEESTRVAALKIGQADIIEISKDRSFDLKKEGVNVISLKDAYVPAFLFHQQWDPGPFNDKRVRRALMLGMNREEIAKIVLRGEASVPTEAPNHPGALGYDPNRKQPYPFDPEGAKKLLKEAGYEKGFEVNAWAFSRPGLPEIIPVMEAIASYWDKIGVKTKIIPLDYSPFRSQWRAKKLPPNSVSTVTLPSVAFPIGFYNLFVDKTSPFLLIAENPEVEKLRKAAEMAVAPEDYAKAMRQLIDRLYEEDLLPPFFYLNQPFATGPKVQSWTVRPVPYSFSLDLVTIKK